ncbi:MAG: flagellar basal body protein, partial [Lachnospiraceae bacterium]
MLRSTFSGFTTARLAMRASQGSLDVVGQNIANLNTDGYTRQRLDVVSIHNSNSGPLAIGYGVEIKSISQVRDPFLDVQYRSQIAKVGYADSRQ